MSQPCCGIIIPMDKASVINRFMEFLGGTLFVFRLSLFVLLIWICVATELLLDKMCGKMLGVVLLCVKV